MEKNKREKWEDFEKKVYDLLKNCGFADINGGPSCKFNANQVDVCGGFDKFFLIIDCHATLKGPGAKSIREKLELFKGRIESITKGVKEKYSSKYTKFLPILAVKDIDISEIDNEKAKELGIYLWPDKYLKAYDKISRITKEYTKYPLVKELIKEDLLFSNNGESKEYEVTAFKIDPISKASYIYFFPMSAEKLLQLTYVFRLEANPELENKTEGNKPAYQRLLNLKKIKEIGNFLSEGNYFKNNVLVILDKNPKECSLGVKDLSVDGSANLVNLLIPKAHCSMRMIDGQHRLYGHLQSRKEDLKKKNLLVVVLVDKNGVDEARTFVNINHKQTAVPSVMLWDLFSETDPNGIEGIISRLVKLLNTKGIFKKKIYIPSNRRGMSSSNYKINIANFCKSLLDRKLISNPKKLKDKKAVLFKVSKDPPITKGYDILNGYFNIIKTLVSKDWFEHFVMTNNGVNVLIRVLDQILSHFKGVFNKKRVEKLIKDGLKKYTLIESPKEAVKRTSSEGFRGNEAIKIIRAINESNKDFAKEFLKDKKLIIEKNELIEELENSLRKCIDNIYSEVSEWWKHKVPLDVKETAKKNSKKRRAEGPYDKRLYQINMEDYFKIILHNWKDFKPIFYDKYREKTDISFIKRKIISFRNDVAHAAPNISPSDEKEFGFYATQIIDTINKYLVDKTSLKI